MKINRITFNEETGDITDTKDQLGARFGLDDSKEVE